MKDLTFTAPSEGDSRYDEGYEFKLMLNGEVLQVVAPGQSVEVKRFKKVTADSLIEELVDRLREDGELRADEPLGRKLLEFRQKV